MNHHLRGNIGLRIIVFMGVATFLFLALMAFGLKKSLQPPSGSRVAPGKGSSPFREDRAWKDVEALQTPQNESPQHRQEYILAALRSAGLRTRQFALQPAGDTNNKASGDILAIVEGSQAGVILLCSAIARPASGTDFGAGNAAWLLEMARVLGAHREGRTLWLLFMADDSGKDSAEVLRASGDLDRVAAILTIDGIADCMLGIQRDPGATPDLTEIVWNTADRKGYGRNFSKLPGRTRGVPIAFRKEGTPTLGLIDPDATLARQGAMAKADSPGGMCGESLRAVGDVIYHALAPIEGLLDNTGLHSDGH